MRGLVIALVVLVLIFGTNCVTMLSINTLFGTQLQMLNVWHQFSMLWLGVVLGIYSLGMFDRD